MLSPAHKQVEDEEMKKRGLRSEEVVERHFARFPACYNCSLTWFRSNRHAISQSFSRLSTAQSFPMTELESIMETLSE